jgi:hypothetical protein
MLKSKQKKRARSISQRKVFYFHLLLFLLLNADALLVAKKKLSKLLFSQIVTANIWKANGKLVLRKNLW